MSSQGALFWFAQDTAKDEYYDGSSIDNPFGRRKNKRKKRVFTNSLPRNRLEKKTFLVL